MIAINNLTEYELNIESHSQYTHTRLLFNGRVVTYTYSTLKSDIFTAGSLLNETKNKCLKSKH